MVKMEWQNAIYKASKGKCKVIPVRLDSSSIPAILAQNLYIDLYSNGLDIAIGQIVNVIHGNTTFAHNNNNFSNLTYEIITISNNEIEIKICANYFYEPIPYFLILVENNENELEFKIKNETMFTHGFNKGIQLTNDKIVNAESIKSPRGITPKMPLRISIGKNCENFKIFGILHQVSEGEYSPIPLKTN